MPEAFNRAACPTSPAGLGGGITAGDPTASRVRRPAAEDRPAGLRRYGDLAPPARQLLGLMRQIRYGSIEQLHVRDGKPTFNPPPRVIREFKLGSPPIPQSTDQASDFLLKSQCVELFDLLAQLPDGVVSTIDVRAGLPFRLILADAPTAWEDVP